MFKIKGPILAATDLKGSDELLRQADTLARSYHVKLSACRVIPEIFAVRLLLTQLHLDDAQRLYDLEAAVRNALLKRIRTVTRREPPRIEMETEQGTVHAGILWAADCIGAGVVVVRGSRSQGAKHPGRRYGEQVIRYAPCAVLVARPSPAGKALAASDFSDLALLHKDRDEQIIKD
jgi:nucleotide-binding universal stress UspA family protein